MNKKTTVLILICVLFSVNAQAQNIVIKDTRAINSAPNFYNKEVSFDFKDRSVLNGVPGSGTYSGMLTIAPWADNSGDAHHQLNFNEGGIFWRLGQPDATAWDSWSRLVTEGSNGKVGIGTTTPLSVFHLSGGVGGATVDQRITDISAGVDAKSWSWQMGTYVGANVFRLRAINDANTNGINAIEFTRTGISGISTSFNGGNVGIGTTTPDQKLTVAGTIKSEEIIVEASGADFVFEEDYDLPTLAQIETFIKANKHLEGIASAKEMQTNGVKVGELQIQLLQKIEELTLYTIEQEAQLKKERSINNTQQTLIEELLKRIEKLEKEGE